MPHFGLERFGHLRKAELYFRHIEDGVVAKAAIASACHQDLAWAVTFHFKDHTTTGVSEGQGGGEASGTGRRVDGARDIQLFIDTYGDKVKG